MRNFLSLRLQVFEYSMCGGDSFVTLMLQEEIAKIEVRHPK